MVKGWNSELKKKTTKKKKKKNTKTLNVQTSKVTTFSSLIPFSENSIMRQSCFIANQSGRDILVAKWPYTDLPIMAIKGTTFSSWVYYLKQFPNPLVSLQKNAIISNFQNLFSNQKFESFSNFLIKLVMHVTWIGTCIGTLTVILRNLCHFTCI